MGGTGSVVTSAGLVFAFTMMSMAVSELTVIGQVGTTIGLGLLFDTLVVRSFMTPSIAALLGKWFWWPQRVRTRPVPAPWPSHPKAHPGKPNPSPSVEEEDHECETRDPAPLLAVASTSSPRWARRRRVRHGR